MTTMMIWVKPILLSTLTKTEYMDIRNKLQKQGVTTVPTYYKITQNQPEMKTLFYGNENEDDNSVTTTVDLLPQLSSCIKTTCTECNIKKSVQDKDMDVKVLTKRFQHRQG